MKRIKRFTKKWVCLCLPCALKREDEDGLRIGMRGIFTIASVTSVGKVSFQILRRTAGLPFMKTVNGGAINGTQKVTGEILILVGRFSINLMSSQSKCPNWRWVFGIRKTAIIATRWGR